MDYLLVKLNKQTNTVYEMHRRGINMRHIGRLRKLVKNKYWRIMLLSEAMSRCIKHQIRYKMRYPPIHYLFIYLNYILIYNLNK